MLYANCTKFNGIKSTRNGYAVTFSKNEGSLVHRTRSKIQKQKLNKNCNSVGLFTNTRDAKSREQSYFSRKYKSIFFSKRVLNTPNHVMR